MAERKRKGRGWVWLYRAEYPHDETVGVCPHDKPPVKGHVGDTGWPRQVAERILGRRIDKPVRVEVRVMEDDDG